MILIIWMDPEKFPYCLLSQVTAFKPLALRSFYLPNSLTENRIPKTTVDKCHIAPYLLSLVRV